MTRTINTFLILWFVWSAACDECQNSSDCALGSLCRDGKCVTVTQSFPTDNDTGVDYSSDFDTSFPIDTGRATGQGGDTSTQTDEDAGMDAASGQDTATDTDTGWPTCKGGRRDPSTGLCWEDPPSDEYKRGTEAFPYCASLEDGEWRVPTISELRTLISNCPSTHFDMSWEQPPDDSCGVYDACTSETCAQAACTGCPGNPCQWQASLSGTCGWYWSVTEILQDPEFVWYVDFENAAVSSITIYELQRVRCVR